MRENEVKRKLANGGTSVGTMVFDFFVPGIPRILAAASRGPSPLPFARVPGTEYHFMAGALDAGMLGLMIPMVEDAAQARKIVESTRYQPLGRRGAGFGMAQDDYERASTSDK